MTSPTGRDDPLDQIRDALPDWAAATGLHLVPAVPRHDGPHSSVDLDPDEMTARQFTDLAAAVADPRVLYCAIAAFDPDEHRNDIEDNLAAADEAPETPDEIPPEALAHLTAAERHRGRCTSIHLAFLAGPVIHTWQHEAAWYSDWATELDSYLPDQDDPPGEQGEEAVLQQLADQLTQLPEFRAATRPRRHRIAVTTLTGTTATRPVSADTARWAADRASHQLDEEADDYFSGLQDTQLEALAQELAHDPSYLKATKADVRRHRAQQFLAARTGFRPPALTVALLLDTPPLQRGSRSAAPSLTDPLFR